MAHLINEKDGETFQLMGLYGKVFSHRNWSSDGKRTKDFFEGKKIYEISEMKVNLDAPIIVAMNVRNTHEVKQYLTPFRNVLMWE